MAQKFTNKALTTLAANISAVDVTLTVAAGTGAKYPIIDGASNPNNDFFVVTLENSAGAYELIRVDHHLTGDTFGSGTYPLQRAYWDGATHPAAAWTGGTVTSVDLRPLAQTMEAFNTGMFGTNNLSELTNKATARSTLGISATNTPFTPTGAIIGADTQAAVAGVDSALTTHKSSTSSAHTAGAVDYGGSTYLAAGTVDASLTTIGNSLTTIGNSLNGKQAADPQLDTLAAMNSTRATELAALSAFMGGMLSNASAVATRNTLEVTAQIQPVVASVATNALTLTLNPTTLAFRSTTLTNGASNVRSVGAAISVVVSSGSTLGTINAKAARLAILAIDNAGTVELAVVNLAGGNNLDETTLISTTAEGGAGAADSANVIYSNTARTLMPFRVVGFIDITEATAGTWATAPTTVQGAGGQALTPLGNGRTWSNPAGRALNTTYYNTTGRELDVAVSIQAVAVQNTSTTALYVTAPGGSAVTVSSVGIGGNFAGTSYGYGQMYARVPPGYSYSAGVTNVGSGMNLSVWAELS